MNIKIITVSVAAILLVSACSNFVRLDTLQQLEVKRSNERREYVIGSRSERIADSIFEVQAEVIKSADVETLENTVKRKEFTPYVGVYEFYEFPCGLLMLPVGVVTNVMNVALLWMLPDKMTEGSLNIAFTGMNPCLNWESEKRLVSIVDSAESKVIDKKHEVDRLPVQDQALKIFAGETVIAKPRTDAKGYCSVDLLDNNTMPFILDNRELTVDLAGERKTFVVSHELKRKIYLYQDIIKTYHETPGPEQLALAVLKLESLRLDGKALLLERKELARFSEYPEFEKAYRTKLEEQIRTGNPKSGI